MRASHGVANKPLIGQTISRSKESAYRYLPASVLEFPDGEALAERMRRQGLVNVEWHPLTFGIATLYVGTKRSRGGSLRAASVHET